MQTAVSKGGKDTRVENVFLRQFKREREKSLFYFDL